MRLSIFMSVLCTTYYDMSISLTYHLLCFCALYEVLRMECSVLSYAVAREETSALAGFGIRLVHRLHRFAYSVHTACRGMSHNETIIQSTGQIKKSNTQSCQAEFIMHMINQS